MALSLLKHGTPAISISTSAGRVFQRLTAETCQLRLNLSSVRKLHGSMKSKWSAGSQE